MQCPSGVPLAAPGRKGESVVLWKRHCEDVVPRLGYAYASMA